MYVCMYVSDAASGVESNATQAEHFRSTNLKPRDAPYSLRFACDFWR